MSNLFSHEKYYISFCSDRKHIPACLASLAASLSLGLTSSTFLFAASFTSLALSLATSTATPAFSFTSAPDTQN